MVLVLVLASLAQAGDSIRVRVAWGGPVARLWQGSITLSEGTLSELRPLGIEADEPGSMWLDGQDVVVHEPSGRLYDGFDVLVDGPVDRAKLRVHLTADGDPKPSVIEIPLADLLRNPVSTDLDQQGTRLLVRRAPGDALRVKFDRRHLIFSPGETFSLEVRPNLLDGGSKSRELKVQMRVGRSGSDEPLWDNESTFEDAVGMAIPMQVDEGVYDLVISVVEMPSLQLRPVGSVPLRLKPKVLAERKVQLLVLDPKVPAPSAETGTLRTVEEINPAEGRWWEKFAKRPAALSKLQLGAWPRLWQGPLGSGDVQSREHPLGRLTQLAPSPSPANVSWEAYTMPIQRPGQPHVLEVEYPSDVPQQLGISLWEPNAADALMPIQLDSGVTVAEEIVASGEAKPRMLTHRLVFWPHTKAPLVLMTNQSSTRTAVYGKIRLLDGWSHLPPQNADPPADQTPRRLAAAYFDRPLFPESFCATEAYDAWSQRSLDDWLTFYQGGSRMVEYLAHTGMNGTMISVLCEGGSLYPSALVQPTPRYDKGPFFDSGQDPVGKDVLEMLLRMFDRRGMKLVAAMEFAAPLPELEQLLRAGGPQCEGIRWTGPNGLTWEQVYRPHRRMAPYYNLLDPRVQAAVLRVIRELVDNYGRSHESFSGIAVQLAGYGYGQLPGPDWGMDDATVARFERETGLRVPAATGPDRFAKRHVFLTTTARRAWMQWRCDSLRRFYDRVQSEMTAVCPRARLYLTTANLLAGPHWQQRLRPTLSSPATLADVLLEAGIDPAQFRRPDGPILVQTQRVAAPHSLDAQAAESAIKDLLDGPEAECVSSCPASLCFHPPLERRLESFDAKSPYRPTFTVLHSQLVPSSHQNRRRFIHELAAHDPLALFDGGHLLPMGQQDAMAGLIATYRHLPAIPMQKLETPSAAPSVQPVGLSAPEKPTRGRSTQPVTVRYGSHSGATYVYAVNDSSVPASLSLEVIAPPDSRLEPLADGMPSPEVTREAGRMTWRVALAPYGLAAAKVNAPGATFGSPVVSLPGTIRDSLAARIRDLGDRLGDLRIPPPLAALSNGRFEEPAAKDGTVPGWVVQKADGGTSELQRDANRAGGSQIVRLASSGTPVSLLSAPFAPPPTGRLSMFVWLRVPDAKRQPSVELLFEGRVNGEPFSRGGILGRSVDGYAANPISEQWRQFIFRVNDLPLEGLSDLQVGLRLAGAGEVWIDDVELLHLEFTSDELRQLSRVISSAETKLDANQLSDCLRLLEGYWPSFLERNVPLRASVARRTSVQAETPPEPDHKKPASPSLMDRLRKMAPRSWW